jgi:broad specificity phosphatase PhoE
MQRGGFMHMGTFCTVFLIRHGETAWNQQGRIQGQLDSPLCEEGEKQAEELQRSLIDVDFSAVFSSCLSRAHRTAEIVLGSRKLTIEKTSALIERNMGEWETHEGDELRALLKQMGNPLNHLPQEEYLAYKLPGGAESYAEVYERLSSFLTIQAKTYSGKTILVSTHGGVLRSVLYTKNWQPGFFWKVPNCSYLTLRVYPDGVIQYTSKNASTPAGKPPEQTSDTFTPW